MKDIIVAGRAIGASHKPFVIAEMSGNHNQSKERCMALVKAAADAGVDALKIQTYTAETMTMDLSEGEFYVDDKDNPWQGQSLYELYEKAHTPWDWHREIFEYANDLGMIAFSSPFDSSAVDFLETLNVPLYKIASFEMTDLPLIKRVAQTGKPMIMSTGMATVAEIDEAVSAAREAGCEQLVLLKCTSTYPSSPEHSNVATIPHLRELSGCQVGLSDHTLGVGVAVAAVAFGATVVEKHFTLSRAEGGVDAAFSLEPAELKLLVDELERAWQSIGEVHYGCTSSELKSIKYRRSIYASRDIKSGEVLSADNLRIIRPGLGLAPKYWQEIQGKVSRQDIAKGSALSWHML